MTLYDITRWEWHGNSLGTWALGFLAWFVVVVAVLFVRDVLKRHLSALADRTGNRMDNAVADAVVRTRSFFAVALGLLAFLVVVDLGGKEHVLQRIVVVAGVLQAGLWAIGLVHFGVDRFAASRTDPGIGSATGVLRVIGTGLVWIVVGLVVLDNIGVDVTAGIAGLGVGGIAVALAVQNVLGDLFASLSIVMDRPFSVGDFITVGAESGTVEHIGLKTTRLRSISGELLVMGNSDLLQSRIRNFKHMTERRAVLPIAVVYETPRAKVERIPGLLREAVAPQEKVRFDRAHFKGFGAAALDFELVYFVSSPDYLVYMDIQQAVNLAILASFEREGIDFAHPAQPAKPKPAEMG